MRLLAPVPLHTGDILEIVWPDITRPGDDTGSPIEIAFTESGISVRALNRYGALLGEVTIQHHEGRILVSTQQYLSPDAHVNAVATLEERKLQHSDYVLLDAVEPVKIPVEKVNPPFVLFEAEHHARLWLQKNGEITGQGWWDGRWHAGDIDSNLFNTLIVCIMLTVEIAKARRQGTDQPVCITGDFNLCGQKTQIWLHPIDVVSGSTDAPFNLRFVDESGTEDWLTQSGVIDNIEDQLVVELAAILARCRGWLPSNQLTHVLCICPHYWGIGATEMEAKANCKAAGGKLTKYVLYRVHPDSSVNEIGGIQYPMEHKPLLLKRYRCGNDER